MMENELRQTCRELLEGKKVDVVIGYGQKPDGRTYPLFVTDPADVEKLVWNSRCYANLASYLSRREVRALGRPAVVVKGCDAKALVVLENESQIDRGEIIAIGMACEGVTASDDSQELAAKCTVCDVHMPQATDITIGEVDNPPVSAEDRYARLEQLMQMPLEERLAYWRTQLDRCIKCYACRQVCPLCYCNQCLADKNRPQVIDTSATMKGNCSWHISRGFHLAGRCIGCGECARACPVGIDLDLLNLSMAKSAEQHFGFRAGTEQGAEPLIGSFSEDDKESFIR